MKRIAFVGTISKKQRSTQLVNLYNESRIYNTEHNIKGVFLVYKNIILQVLEGDASELGKAIYRARREDQYEEFGIIVNSDIEKGVFKNWLIRFVKQNTAAKDSFITKLNGILHSQLNFNNSREKELYNNIFFVKDSVVSFPASNTNVTTAENDEISDLNQQSYSIPSWPKPTQVRLTPKIIKSCSMLAAGFISFDDLRRQASWESEQELKEFLLRLKQLNLLQFQKVSNVKFQQPSVDSGDKFSQLLKKFIHAPRRQVT